MSKNSFYYKNLMYGYVFSTGAVVLVLEVLAVRILSPYFGNTLYTVTGVISVILAALSFGYYAGGRLSDFKPSDELFFGIVCVGGVSIILTRVLMGTVLPQFAHVLSIDIGPLISALVLFFMPCLLLGMLSPFAIRLQHIRAASEGIGTIAGKIFFWSTLGSIAGSLSTAFILIPRFGVDSLIITFALIMLAIGLIPLAVRADRRSRLSLLILIAVGVSALFLPRRPHANIVYEANGQYEHIVVIDGEYHNRPTRFLVTDRSYSGAMYLESPEIVFDYAKYYASYKAFVPHPNRMLVIGGAPYTIPFALHRDEPLARIDVVEIDPTLYEVSKKYFRVPTDARFTNYTNDGRRFLQDTEQTYDVILLDAYRTLYSAPSHLVTREFFDLARQKLNPQGVVIANVIGSLSRQSPSLFFSILKTFKETFPQTHVIAVNSHRSTNVQNIIVIGSSGNKGIPMREFQVNNPEAGLHYTLGDNLVDINRYNLSSYPVLTDAFSPVDYLAARSNFRRPQYLTGEEMLGLIKQQLSYGPRFVSSQGHDRTAVFLEREMRAFADEVYVQKWDHAAPSGAQYSMANIVGRFFPEREGRIILGTHYDSKQVADKDLLYSGEPVPGANDSASGVSVLIELARYITQNKDSFSSGIDIVFFDGEEGVGDVAPNPESIGLGSRHFAQLLPTLYSALPEQAVILDMVCDADLEIYREENSQKNAKSVVDRLWTHGISLSPNSFHNTVRYEIIDDHIPLIEAGIPSALIIDYDYPRFHTTRDTIEGCSGKSLETVAHTLRDYLIHLQEDA